MGKITAKSPLRWAGGKQKVADRIIERFPRNIIHFVEPFCGGASVFLAAKSLALADEFVINDKYSPLISFWRTVRDNGDLLCRRLRHLHAYLDTPEKRKRRYLKTKDLFLNLAVPHHEAIIRQATDFFYLNRCTWSGCSQSGGYSASAAHNRFTESSIDRIQKLVDSKVLDGVSITISDAFDVIERYQDIAGSFFYIDAPYVSAKKLYGNHGELHAFDHARLADKLASANTKFLMTYDNVPEIRWLYRWANLEPFNIQYSMGTKRAAGELFISNY